MYKNFWIEILFCDDIEDLEELGLEDLLIEGNYDDLDELKEQALRNVSTDYARLQSNYEKLKLYSKSLEETNETLTKELFENFHKGFIHKSELQNLIPTSTVNEMIKELENNNTQLPTEHLRQAQIKILQELIKRSDKDGIRQSSIQS